MSNYYLTNGTVLERAIYCDEVTLRTWQREAMNQLDWATFDRVTESIALQRKMVFGALAVVTTEDTHA